MAEDDVDADVDEPIAGVVANDGDGASARLPTIVRGEVVSVDAAAGRLEIAAGRDRVALIVPPPALAGVRFGQRVTVSLTVTS
jgi:hypothetical protein